MDFDSTRWAIYLIFGPVALAAFLLIGSPYKKLLVLIATLIFLEGVLLTWRSFFFVGFSLSSALSYAFLFSLIIVPSLRSRMPAFSLRWVAFLFFALTGVVIGSFVRGIGLGANTTFFQLFYLEGLFYFWIGRAVLRDSSEGHKVLVWFVILGGLVAILHLFTLTTGYRFYNSANQAFDVYSQVAFRYGAVFANPNTLADFYAMAIPIGLVLSLGWRRPRGIAMPGVIVSLSLMSVSLLLTASRGGLAAAVLASGLAVLLLPVDLRRLAGLAAFGLAAGGVALILLLFILPEFFDQAMARFTEEGINTGRYRIWAVTLEILAKNPMGLGLHHAGYLQAMQKFGLHYSTPHSIYLGLAVNTGILGLIAFLSIVGGSLRRVQLARRFGDEMLRTVATAILVALLGFLAGGLSEPIYRNDFKLQHIFWIFVGMGSYLPAWIAAQDITPQGAGGSVGWDPRGGPNEGFSLPPRQVDIS